MASPLPVRGNGLARRMSPWSRGNVEAMTNPFALAARSLSRWADAVATAIDDAESVWDDLHTEDSPEWGLSPGSEVANRARR